MITKIIIGPPGTGKTTHLIGLLQDELKVIPPNRIGFFSFTRKGAYEAKDRVIDKFSYTDDDLPYFRTLHSLAFFELGITPNLILKAKHYTELSNILKVNLTNYQGIEDVPANRFLFLDHYSRNRAWSLSEGWRKLGEDEQWHYLKHVIDTIKVYKKEKGLFDFTDLVEKFIERGRSINLDVVFIDEAQDLTTLQWAMVKVAFKNVKRMYIAGDDDQSIYKWAGADVEKFLSLKGNFTTLRQSWRIPSSIHAYSQKIVKRISRRFAKEFNPRDEPGSVQFYHDLDAIKLNSDTWLFLARNNYLLKKFEDSIRRQGHAYRKNGKSSVNKDSLSVIYAWEKHRKGAELVMTKTLKHVLGGVLPNKQMPWFDAFKGMPVYEREYYRACLRRGDSLKKPTIKLSTIHKAKGGQADHVVLLYDMTWKTFQAFQKNPDDEHRVFYVGVTRAKKSLHVIMPESTLAYPI